MTYEVARRDDEDGVLWRVSIAVCERPCPFSRFEGLERQLLVVDGEPMRLVIDGRTVLIGVGDPPVRFAGEASVDCTPLGAPTLDLNLMSRRGALDATLHAPGQVTGLRGEGLVVALGSDVRVGGERLGQWDALLLTEQDVLELSAEAASACAVVSLRAF